jgi:hypothetical protein
VSAAGVRAIPFEGAPAEGGALLRLRRFAEREAHALAAVALLLAFVLVLLPAELVQDSWLALVAGREVVENDLPHRDALTVIGAGRDWVDQQWLAQATLFLLRDVGGLGALLAVHVAAVAGAFALAVVAARRLGGSGRAVLGVAVVAALLAPWGLQLRPQSLVHVLFVALVWLLAAESRRPSSRALLALLLLVVWANLHGSVVLGALLVSLLGVIRLRGSLAAGSRRGVAVALAGLPWLCTLASPYALDLPGYYGRMLVAPAFADHVSEWQPAWSSGAGLPFLVVVPAALLLVVRRRVRLTAWEHAALGLTAVGGALALRGVIWFALAALVLLPRLLEAAGEEGTLPAPARRVRLGLCLAAACGGLLVVGATLAAPSSRYDDGWPAGAQAAVVRAAEADPTVRIFATDRYADWLLWRHPELRGRVAYDARFELLAAPELERLSAFLHRRGTTWRDAAAPYGLLVLDRRYPVADALGTDAATTVLYRDADVVVLSRRSAP